MEYFPLGLVIILPQDGATVVIEKELFTNIREQKQKWYVELVSLVPFPVSLHVSTVSLNCSALKINRNPMKMSKEMLTYRFKVGHQQLRRNYS